MWGIRRGDQAQDGTATTAVRLESVSKTYGEGAGSVHALREVSLAFAYGSFTAVMGPSGSGKSTLLHCAAGLDAPTSGHIFIGQTDISRLNETKRTELRRERIGFVFQSFNLLPALTVEQNITLPALLAGKEADEQSVADVLERVGLSGMHRRRPAELSGGQQQRVAIARALASSPEVVFADEPTGALDLRSGRDVLALFRSAVDSFQQTVVMVTHDPVAASYADSVIFLADGRVAGELRHGSAEAIATELTRLTGPGSPP